MQRRFENQVALVTGAAAGLGFGAAEAFAKEGAQVVMADWNKEAVERSAQQLAAQGFKTFAVHCDVSNESQVKKMIDETLAKFGRLDAAYNNAGIQIPHANLADTATEDYDKLMAINLRGIFLCMKYEIPVMLKQGSGAIVNCSSLSGVTGGPGYAAYSAAKHAIIGLSSSAGAEYATSGIRINAVCPGMIHTPMADRLLQTQPDAINGQLKNVPIRRMGTMAEIADAVLWLCSPGASYMVGHALVVDGGFTSSR